jgi:hypothetical protein
MRKLNSNELQHVYGDGSHGGSSHSKSGSKHKSGSKTYFFL